MAETKKTEIDVTKFYDLIFDIDYLAKGGPPFRGWEIFLPQESKSLLPQLIPAEFKNKTSKQFFYTLKEQEIESLSNVLLKIPNNSVFVSVLGQFDKGKTWLLSKLSPSSKLGDVSGMTTSTRGISVKLCDKRFIFLDTAGSNSPISQQLLMTAEEELRQKTDPKYLSYLRTINESKSSDLKLEEESRNQAMNAKTEYVRNRAFVDKKATEIFLQNLIFQLSDVLIFVQHEMTWTDQQMLHILQLKIEQIASSQSSNYPRNPLIVIHNFKTTKTRQEFKSLRRTFVYQCFAGVKTKVLVTLPGSGQQTEVSVWMAKQRNMIHLCLAEEGSEAGNYYNFKTLEYLRNFITVAQGAPNPMNFFQKIATTVCEEMKKFFSNVQQAQFLYFGQKEPTLRLFVQSKNNEDLHLFRDGLEFDGVALSLRPTLQLSADTIQVDDQTIVIVVDCPGLFLKLKRDNSTQQIPHDCQSHFEITYLPNLNGRPCLKLQGRRQLYYKYWTSNGVANICYNYDKDEKNAIIRRIDGDFETIIPLPPGFLIDHSTIRYELHDGILQIRLTKQIPSNMD